MTLFVKNGEANDGEYESNRNRPSPSVCAHRFAQSFDAKARLQTKDGICSYLGHISHATYDAWQAKGIVPGPIPGTNRYDMKQHDHLLDQKLGLSSPERKLSALEKWEMSQ